MRIKDVILEGGWDTTLTQSTVLHPKVVGTALQVVDGFVDDFNQYLSKQNLGPIRRGRATGSSAYHEEDTIEYPEKIYGDIDLQMVAPETEGMTQGQFTLYWNTLTADFIKAGLAPYVDVTESKPGHPVFNIGGNDFVQIDFMWHPERLSKWGASRVTPQRGVKGLLTGNMYSVLGSLLDMSIQHAGVQLKVIDGKKVPFSKQKGTEIQTITTEPTTFIYDTFIYLAREMGVKNPKISPLLTQFPGNDIEDVKISKLVNSVKGFAESCEANDMFGKGDLANYADAEDFMNQFWNLYEKKALEDIASKKRDKATTPEAKARAEEDKNKILQGLNTVKQYFN